LARANLTAVKTFRIWLLLLLAVLLPVRGAMAAAMHCSAPGSRVQVEAQMTKEGHSGHEAGVMDQGAQHEYAGAHDHTGGHTHSDKGGSHDHAGAADKCNLCSASCSATGLVSASVTVPEPSLASSVFPHLYAQPPSFVSDGQERPPRTI